MLLWKSKRALKYTNAGFNPSTAVVYASDLTNTFFDYA